MGISTKPLKTIRPVDLKCPDCGAQGTVSITLYSQRENVSTHVGVIFTVPAFEFNRYGESRCSSCGNKYDDARMPSKIRVEYHQLYATTQTPASSYTGLIFMMIVIIFTILIAILTAF